MSIQPFVISTLAMAWARAPSVPVRGWRNRSASFSLAGVRRVSTIRNFSPFSFSSMAFFAPI